MSSRAIQIVESSAVYMRCTLYKWVVFTGARWTVWDDKNRRTCFVRNVGFPSDAVTLLDICASTRHRPLVQHRHMFYQFRWSSNSNLTCHLLIDVDLPAPTLHMNLGLMTQNNNDPNPQAMPSPEALTPISPEDLASMTIQTEIPQLLQLPVSRSQSGREFDRMAREETRVDDFGLPVPSVELIDDQPVASHVRRPNH